MFRTVPLSIIRSFSLYTQQWYMSYRFADCCRAESGWNTVSSSSCSTAVSKPVWHIPLLCVQWKTPDDGQRNCPKHVEFNFKNKFEKLVYLVGFIIRNPVFRRVQRTQSKLISSVSVSCFYLRRFAAFTRVIQDKTNPTRPQYECLTLRRLMSYIYIYIYIYIWDISSLKLDNLTLILLTWRKWWAPNNASK